MKIVIGYPPTESEKGIALLSQNRQFQWFKNETKIFPVIMASSATMLKKAGHDVIWKDCIAENISYEKFIKFLKKEEPNLFIFETKTPVVKIHWNIINSLKKTFPNMKIAVLGDHITAMPEEIIKNSKVDFAVCGGDYDFAVSELVDAIEKKKKMPKGVLYKKQKGKKICGDKNFVLSHNLDDVPFIDRELTKWHLYQKEYNLKGRPFAYIMSGRDCWHGKCTFCSWTTLYPRFRVRSVENVLNEIGMLIDRYGIKEVFDDSGSLMIGKWLKELCYGLIKRGYNKKIRYSCNMRYGALNLEDYKLMKKAGFRLLKFGLESANQTTLDKLNKNIRVNDIIQGSKMAKKAGLTVHLTMIVGYPWENKSDALRTFKLAKGLMQKGYADLLQSTVLIPYPGTPLYRQALKKKWFLINPNDYEKFDMRAPVLKTKMKPEDAKEICNKIYTIFLTPRYILQRILSLRSLEDIKFNLRGVKAVFGHLKDFGEKKNAE